MLIWLVIIQWIQQFSLTYICQSVTEFWLISGVLKKFILKFCPVFSSLSWRRRVFQFLPLPLWTCCLYFFSNKLWYFCLSSNLPILHKVVYNMVLLILLVSVRICSDVTSFNPNIADLYFLSCFFFSCSAELEVS